MNQRHFSRQRVAVGAALLAVLGLALWRAWRGPPNQSQGSMAQGNRMASPPGSGAAAPVPVEARTSLRSAAKSLTGAAEAGSARQVFSQLRTLLSSLPPGAASAVLGEFLDSKSDARSRLEFKVGPNGFLTEPSSLRVFLLDYLAQVDLPTAARYAESVLISMDSPDEWAVSLRNYALANPTPGGRAYLQQKLREMLRHQPWQKNPSVGFLEAFDVAVYAGGTELVPTLAELLRQKENPAVAHAAYLALDRLVLADAASTLRRLQDEPDLLSSREATRADYFGRADVQDATQRRVLEDYLLSPQLGAAELEQFAGLYPNANFMISHNLLTRTPTPDHDTLVRRDAAALRVIQDWISDPRFASLRPQLERIQRRLENFLAPSRRGP